MLRAALGVVLVAAAACGRQSREPAPAPEAPQAELLEVRMSGGMCATGRICHQSLLVAQGGSWTRDDNGRQTTGTISSTDVEGLAALVEAEIGAVEDLPRKSPRSCASAHDGQDRSYRFTGGLKRVEVSSCDVLLSGGNPLLRRAAQLYEQLR